MAVQEVQFEWADGPNANAEGHKLRAFTPDGVEFSPRMQVKASHKNGQWSYNDQIVFVPEGTLIFQLDQSTHGSSSRVDKIWVAVAGRPQVFTHHGLWRTYTTWPSVDQENPYVSDALLKKVLAQIVAPTIAADWDASTTVSHI